MAHQNETPSVDTLLIIAKKLGETFNRSASAATSNEKRLLELLTYTLQNVKETQEENKKLKKKLAR